MVNREERTFTKGFVFYAKGDPSVGIPSSRFEFRFDASVPLDKYAMELRNAICATISDHIAERVTTQTIEQEEQNNAAENAYYERLDKQERESSERLIASSNFTDGLD